MGRSKLQLSEFFAITLQRTRRSKGLFRQALAEQAGLHQTAVGLIERGLRKPNLDTAHLLAQALEVELSEMIRQSELLQRRSENEITEDRARKS